VFEDFSYSLGREILGSSLARSCIKPDGSLPDCRLWACKGQAGAFMLLPGWIGMQQYESALVLFTRPGSSWQVWSADKVAPQKTKGNADTFALQ
jgi:hypothetical protein